MEFDIGGLVLGSIEADVCNQILNTSTHFAALQDQILQDLRIFDLPETTLKTNIFRKLSFMIVHIPP